MQQVGQYHFMCDIERGKITFRHNSLSIEGPVGYYIKAEMKKLDSFHESQYSSSAGKLSFGI